MEEKVLTCLTCRVAFADLDAGRDHYKSDWHRYNLKRKVAQMDPVTADFFRTQVVMRHDKVYTDGRSCFEVYVTNISAQTVKRTHLK